MKRDTDLIAELYRSVSPDNKRLVRALETRLNQAKADTARYRGYAETQGATQHIPLRYLSAINTIAGLAFTGILRPEDMTTSRGKQESRAPKHHTPAYRMLLHQQEDLQRRAIRIEQALARMVDNETAKDDVA